MAIPDNLQLKHIYPVPRESRLSAFLYELKYAFQIFGIFARETSTPTITGEFTVNVSFGHGKRKTDPSIKMIREKAEREISELFSKFKVGREGYRWPEQLEANARRVLQVEEQVEEQQEKEQLEIKGFTPMVLSELTDISISWAYRILVGEFMPGREVLAKIADVTGMSMDELNEELLSRQRAAKREKRIKLPERDHKTPGSPPI